MPYGTVNADVIQSSVANTSLGAGNASIMKNRIINGSMQIWQRGTSFPAIGTATYSADRWKATIDGSSLNLTASQDTSTPSLDFKYSLKYQQISSNATSVTEYAARQVFELANVQDLAGKSVTISFWYRSNVTGTHGVRLIPLGTTGGTDTSVAITVNSANTWEYKTVTTTALAAITSWGSTADNAAALILDIGLRVNTIGQTTVNANDYFNLVGVQLEVGTSATGYEYVNYQTLLANCQRYYETNTGLTQYGWQSNASSTFRNIFMNWAVTKRTSSVSTTLIGVSGGITISLQNQFGFNAGVNLGNTTGDAYIQGYTCSAEL